MNTKYKTCDFSETENPGKKMIQTMLYKQSLMKGRPTIVSGPAIGRHLNDAMLISSKNFNITIVEKDVEIYKTIKSNLK